MIRVCILTSVHAPFDTRIYHKEAKLLANVGYDVIIIAVHNKKETVDHIKIVGLQKPRNRIERMTKTVWVMLQEVLFVNADVYHFHDPELIPLGLLLKFIGCKVVYDVHEDTPNQTLNKYYMHPVVRYLMSWMLRGLEWIGGKMFDSIVAATPKIAVKFPARKTVVVQNFPIVDKLVCTEAVPYLERPTSFAYIGGISIIRGAREMVSALTYFSDAQHVRLELVGDFSPRTFEEVLKISPGWASVRYNGVVSHEHVMDILSKVRAGLVVVHPVQNYYHGYPVKMFEYMAAGIPVIASDFPLWRKIVDNAGCGLLVDPSNSKEIAAAMSWILEHPIEAEAMGRRGQTAVRKIYNWNIESTKLKELYERLVETK